MCPAPCPSALVFVTRQLCVALPVCGQLGRRHPPVSGLRAVDGVAVDCRCGWRCADRSYRRSRLGEHRVHVRIPCASERWPAADTPCSRAPERCSRHGSSCSPTPARMRLPRLSGDAPDGPRTEQTVRSRRRGNKRRRNLSVVSAVYGWRSRGHEAPDAPPLNLRATP